MAQNKHEGLVRSIAEDMAKVSFRAHWNAELTDMDVIPRYYPAARIAVKHMADAFEAGYNYACTPCDDPYNGGPYIIFGQEDHGLIPDDKNGTE